MLHAEKRGRDKKVTKNRPKKADYSELRFDSSYPTLASTKPRRIVLHSYPRLDALSLTRYEEERSELCRPLVCPRAISSSLPSL